MHLENEQVKLSMSLDPELLAWLRRTKSLVPCKPPKGATTLKGWEMYELQFDTQPIDFLVNEKTQERTVHPFGESVAKGLVRSSLTVVGDPNSKPIPALEKIATFKLQTGDPVARDPNACPYCGAVTESPTKLAYHINRVCSGWKRAASDEPDEPEESAPAAEPEADEPELVVAVGGEPDGDGSAS